MENIYNNYYFKKWEYLCLFIFTFGKIDDSKLFMKNFSLMIVFGYGTFFFQLVNGYVMIDYPNILKSLYSIGSLFVTCCFFTIIIDYKKSIKTSYILKYNMNSNYEFKFNKDLKDKTDEGFYFNNKYKNEGNFDEELKNKLIQIVKDLNITNTKEFVILLLYVKEKEYQLKKVSWLVENFNTIFNIDIKSQYVSQIRKTELEIFNKDVDFTRTQKESYELYKRIKNYFIDKNELKL